MVKIISNGKIIAICEKPRYIKVKPETGIYIQTDEKHAQGISIDGDVYNLPDHTEISKDILNKETGEYELGIAPEAFTVEIDGGTLLISEINNLKEETNDILCDVDINLEDIKEALCELDERINNDG